MSDLPMNKKDVGEVSLRCDYPEHSLEQAQDAFSKLNELVSSLRKSLEDEAEKYNAED